MYIIREYVAIFLVLLKISKIIEGTCITDSNYEEVDTTCNMLMPVVNELKFLRTKLNSTIFPDLKTLYYDTSDFIKLPKSSKLEQIEFKLRESRTILDLQERTSVFLQKYRRHLQELQRFQIRNGNNDLFKTMERRLKIWNATATFLSLTIWELEESIPSQFRNKSNSYLKNIPLIRIEEQGNYCKMLRQDLHFIDNLNSFVDISVKLFEYRLEVKHD